MGVLDRTPERDSWTGILDGNPGWESWTGVKLLARSPGRQSWTGLLFYFNRPCRKDILPIQVSLSQTSKGTNVGCLVQTTSTTRSGMGGNKWFDRSIVLSGLLLVHSISRSPSWTFPRNSRHHLPSTQQR